MKAFSRFLAIVLTLAVLPLASFAEADTSMPFAKLEGDAKNEQIIDWFNESYGWMTVANGHWSSDPKDQISDEELEKLFSMTTKQQNAVHWTPWYFVVVKDVDEQRKIMGDMWGEPEDMATEGTVTVLVMADQILTKEEGHVSDYDNLYMPTNFAYFDSGLTCGLMGVAAAALGYKTHYFGSINGEYAPKDLADGKYQSLSRYIKDDYMRVWGFPSSEGELKKYPVAGNCVFLAAIVIGKEAQDEGVETWGTNHYRPNNWIIWDGVPNEEPSPAANKAPSADETKQEEGNYKELIGTGEGFGGQMQVKVTMDGDKIIAVEVLSNGETAGVSDKAFEEIPKAIVEANSTDVDVASGATFSSNGIIEAVDDALSKME